MTRPSTLIIAEAGVNHNGSIDMASRLVDEGARAGVDIVKFQTFRADCLVTASARQAEYQRRNISHGSDSQLDMLRRLELSPADHRVLIDRCHKSGVRFLSTPFDMPSIDFLQSLDLGLWKIPSGEITNYPYLKRIASVGQPVIMSTGMCSLGDVEAALNVLVGNGLPLDRVTLLHCTTQYPTPMPDVNLRAMEQLRDTFGTAVGYSDHTRGIEVPIAAVALGAVVIEKHFTLDRSLPGPDHKASLEPDEMCAMVSAIRNIEQALGDGRKRVADSELANIDVARKSIVAAVDIAAGELLTDRNLTVKRPGGGLSPMRWLEVVGTRAVRAFAADEPIVL